MTQRGGYKHSWYTKSHIYDWVSCLGVFVVEQILTNFVINPRIRYEPNNFTLVDYPLLPDIVPAWLLLIICILLPLAIFGGFYFYYRNAHDFHHASLGLVQTFTVTMLFTDFLKIIASRYRPDYAARVALKGVESKLARDGRLSFPSGHSSLSFSCMAFLTFYIAGKTKVFRKDGGSMWKVYLCLVPLMISSLIAVSRTVDYHHDFSDITAGAFIGLSCGVFIYFVNFNSLFSKECALPKSRVSPNYARESGLLFSQEREYTSLSISSSL